MCGRRARKGMAGLIPFGESAGSGGAREEGREAGAEGVVVSSGGALRGVGVPLGSGPG
jgi:hypothetical protein